MLYHPDFARIYRIEAEFNHAIWRITDRPIS
jgi:hypothetical protein